MISKAIDTPIMADESVFTPNDAMKKCSSKRSRYNKYKVNEGRRDQERAKNCGDS